MTIIVKNEYHSAEEFWQKKREELEKNNFVIRVRHERLFVMPVPVKSSISNAIFMDFDQKLMSKKEFAKLIELGEIKTDGKGYKNTKFYLQNNAGVTTVSIYTADESGKAKDLVASAESRVHPADNFNRKTGLIRAFKAAVRKLPK